MCERKQPGSVVSLSPFTRPSVLFTERRGHLQPRPGKPEQVWLPKGERHWSWPGMTPQCLLSDTCLEGEDRDPLGSV